ncbi:MAG TPA: tRNA epoxyqueuosine(34) reductase QueG [Verrucomicrobiae bacterium]|nr:tRNA epoxyqueuosine(34) reductase QueG [Verrucomicrobiae bacterium]
MKAAIVQRAQELGFDACRITSAEPPTHQEQFARWLEAGRHGEMGYLQRNAHKRVDPRKVLSDARTVISLAVSYFGAEEGPIARYARFKDYHDVMGERLKELSAFVNSLAPETQSLWYVDTGPFLERDLAERAGIGFIGKHTNLISRELGNWFFLAEIVTTLEIEPDVAETNRCGNCTRCITACPTEAIIAPFQLDARRCISYLTIELKGAIPEELRPAIGTRIYGCDDCLQVCPWNRFAREGQMMKEHARSDLDTPDLIELLALDDAAFKRRFAGTPMMRTKRRGLLRNVCVALGNVGDRTSLPALKRATMDKEPLIAEHARWAIDRIESRIRPRAACRHEATTVA